MRQVALLLFGFLALGCASASVSENRLGDVRLHAQLAETGTDDAPQVVIAPVLELADLRFHEGVELEVEARYRRVNGFEPLTRLQIEARQRGEFSIHDRWACDGGDNSAYDFYRLIRKGARP